jgi:hypothetical protein
VAHVLTAKPYSEPRHGAGTACLLCVGVRSEPFFVPDYVRYNVRYNLSEEAIMRTRNWLLALMLLSIATPAARAQAGPYIPMPRLPVGGGVGGGAGHFQRRGLAVVMGCYTGEHPFGAESPRDPEKRKIARVISRCLTSNTSGGAHGRVH